MDVEDMKKRIKYSKNIEEIDKIRVEKGKTIGYYKNAKGETVFIVVSESDFDDLKRTVDETRLLLEMMKDKIDTNHRREDAEATRLGSSNYYDLYNFEKREETEEERKRRRETDKKKRISRKQGEKRKLKKHAKELKKKEKIKNRKLKKRIAAFLLAGVAITGAVQGVSAIQADAKEYNETAATVDGLNVNEIYEKAEIELKEKVAEAIGEKSEDINFSVRSIDSTTTETEINAKEKSCKMIVDERGIGSGDGRIAKLISKIKNRNRESREKGVEVLTEVRQSNIFEKDGKIISEKNKDGEER